MQRKNCLREMKASRVLYVWVWGLRKASRCNGCLGKWGWESIKNIIQEPRGSLFICSSFMYTLFGYVVQILKLTCKGKTVKENIVVHNNILMKTIFYTHTHTHKSQKEIKRITADKNIWDTCQAKSYYLWYGKIKILKKILTIQLKKDGDGNLHIKRHTCSGNVKNIQIY